MRKYRIKAAIALCVGVTFFMGVKNPVLAEWKQEQNGAWKWEESGQALKDDWKNVNGKWYYFDENGSMQSGWIQKNGLWYYLDPQNGDMKEDWVKVGDNWYFLKPETGAMATGWMKAADNWYFLDESGSMQTGVIEVDEKIYALDETNGNMYTGTVLLEDKKVYTFNPTTGEAIGDIIPVPTKGYRSDGKRMDGLSISVQQKIKQMNDKKEEENRSNTTYNKNSDKSDGNGNKPEENQPNTPDDETESTKEIKIEDVLSPKNGEVMVTLSSFVDLKAPDFYISCPTGKDMTILSIEPLEDKNAYRILTSYFDDNTYIITITLPDGKKIEKSFVTNGGAPIIKEITAERTTKDSAKISLVSDDVGILYYIAIPTSLSRAAIGQTAPQSAEEVKRDGASIAIPSSGLFEFTITGLGENQGYKLYLATAKGETDAATMRGTLNIPAESKENIDPGDIQIIEAEGVSSSEIKVVFNKPTQEELTIDNFKVTCPAIANISIGRAVTQDRKTYTIYMKNNYFMMSNNTYTVTATFPDGTQTQGKFYGDFQYPLITAFTVKRVAENEIEVTFESDEGGMIYYGTTPNSNEGEIPHADEIVESGKSTKLYSGKNVLSLKINPEDKLFYMIPVDKRGNRPPRFSEREAIPDFSGVPEEGDKPSAEIISIESSVGFRNCTSLKVVFKEQITTSILSNNVSITTLSGEGNTGVPRVVSINPAFGSDTFQIDFNMELAAGTYRLEILVGNKTYTKEFTIP